MFVHYEYSCDILLLFYFDKNWSLWSLVNFNYSYIDLEKEVCGLWQVVGPVREQKENKKSLTSKFELQNLKV